MSDDDYQLEVRLGPHHFAARGPLEAVRQDYQRFLQTVSQAEPPTKFRACGKPWPAVPQELALHFTVHDDGIVTLAHPAPKPISEARSLLMLLYGFLAIESQARVTASDLRQAAQRSGLEVSRIDRALLRYVDKGFVAREGAKRGTQYALTESGISWTRDYLHGIDKTDTRQ